MGKAKKVLVCGSRDYNDRDRINHVLDAHRGRIGPDMLLITGGAPGADELARQWAVSRKVDHLVMYARWELEGRGAGPLRNRRMALKKPKLVLAFSTHFDTSRGTADMIGVAEKLRIKVKRFS
jgi:hypothetical protein